MKKPALRNILPFLISPLGVRLIQILQLLVLLGILQAIWAVREQIRMENYYPSVQEVEVVNRSTIPVSGPIDVYIKSSFDDEPINVNVKNPAFEPVPVKVNNTQIEPVPIYIRR